MQVRAVFDFNFTDWTVWVILGVGVTATVLVIGLAVLYGRWRRRRRANSWGGADLPWEQLLELLRARRRERAAAGQPAEEDLPPELFQKFLSSLSSPSSRSPEIPPEELNFLTGGGVERRTGRRRWGNPTEVSINSFPSVYQLHGLVLNRSTGGLALLVDREIPPGTLLRVRSMEAPPSVPEVEIEVRYCRKASKLFLLGCQFCGEIPWNARVWFG